MCIIQASSLVLKSSTILCVPNCYMFQQDTQLDRRVILLGIHTGNTDLSFCLVSLIYSWVTRNQETIMHSILLQVFVKILYVKGQEKITEDLSIYLSIYVCIIYLKINNIALSKHTGNILSPKLKYYILLDTS